MLASEGNETMGLMPAVAVLMSVYNGEKYIREQLDSIFNQENVHVRLFVRDDGSKDATVGILKEYAQRFPVEIIIDGENVGPGESFMRLVYKYADELGIDYYAFADQDDIWLPEKLSIAIETIKQYDMNAPTLYGSNQYIYTCGENKGDRHKETQKTDLISHITKNTIAGCTFVFNKALAQLVAGAERPDPRILKFRLHDAWMMLVAITCGKAVYDETSHMLYRIHNENTVGVKEITLSERLDRLKRYIEKRDDANIRLLTTKELLRLFPQIDHEKTRVLKIFANYQDNWEKKKALAFNRMIRANCAENPNVFTIKVLTNFV